VWCCELQSFCCVVLSVAVWCCELQSFSVSEEEMQAL
jgi:hypothetical protein